MKTKILELIDKKIDWLFQGRSIPEVAKNSHKMEALEELRQEIEAIEEWIPVTERLPDEYIKVLVFTKYGEILIDDIFKEDEFYLRDSDVTHWMPLPPHT